MMLVLMGDKTSWNSESSQAAWDEKILTNDILTGWDFQTNMMLTPLNFVRLSWAPACEHAPTQWAMGNVFGKASPTDPLSFMTVYYRSSCEPGVKTLELFGFLGWCWLSRSVYLLNPCWLKDLSPSTLPGFVSILPRHSGTLWE